MTKANRSSRHFLILIAAFIVPLSAAHAGTGSFTINNGSTVTSTETLNSGNTGTINAGGTLSEKSGTGIQLSGTTTASGPGNVITVNNSGKILDYNSSAGGAGRAIRDQSGGSNTVINNNSGGLIQGGQNDVIAINIPSGSSAATSPSVMTINNAGTIQSLDSGTSGTTTPSAKGNQAINLTVATGATTVNNESTGVIWATAADAVRPGLNGVVYNDGFIYSNQYDDPSSGYTSSDGIDGQSDSGITIVNGYTTTTVGGTTAKYQSTTALSGYVGATTSVPLTESTIEGGRHGITGGNTGESGGTVQYGGYTGDGVYTMNITNNGGALIEGQDGSGINIDGFGIRNNNGTSYSNELVTVTNYGTITGDGVHGDGDGIDVDGDVTVYNNGTIKSLNAVPEAGSAPGSIEYSEGITVGGGTITNDTNGIIEGSVASGNTQGVGRGITLAGVDKDTNDNAIPIESIYENSTITNSGLIKGDSESGVAVLGTTGGGYKVTITNNATGTIEGKNTGVSEDATLAANASSQPVIPAGGAPSGESLNQGAIELDDTGDTYEIDNYGTIQQDGASGVAVAMHSHTSNALNVYGSSASIKGDVVGDTAADSTMTINPGNGGTFTYGNSISNFTVLVNADGGNGTVNLTGTSSNTGPTSVDAGKLDVSGSIAHSAVTVKSGGTMQGSGSAGATYVQSGGILKAGDSATTLGASESASTNFKFALAGLTLDGGSTLSFSLDHTTTSGTVANPAGGTMFDLGLTGILAAGTGVTAGSIKLDFNNSEVSGSAADPNVYELAAFAPGTDLTTSDFSIENLSIDNHNSAVLSLVTLTDGQEALDLDVIPEPGTWALLLASFAFAPLVWRRIRRTAS